MAEHTYSDDTRDHSGRELQYPVGDDLHDLCQRYLGSLRRTADPDDPDAADPSSVERYATGIRWYDQWLTGEDLTPLTISQGDAELLGTTLASEFNGRTPRQRWDRIHHFHGYLVRVEVRGDNPLDEWHDEVATEFGLTHTPEQEKQLDPGEQYAVTPEEVRAMEEHACIEPLRDRTIIRLSFQTGCRKGEVVGIKHDEHIDMDNREIVIPAKNTKTNQRRVVAYQPSLDPLLRKWLYDGYRDRYAVAEDSPYLFVSRRSPQMSTDAVTDAVVAAADAAGINRDLYKDANEGQRRKVTPHSLRHGFATEMVSKCKDEDCNLSIYQVSKALGHSSVEVTQRMYVDHDPEAGVDAMHRYGPE